MRKTLFGFNTKEVNETIDTLTNQNTALIQRNDRLEEDLKDLKMQLEEAKVANEGLMSRAECNDYETIKNNFAVLTDENKQLNADIQNAKNAVSESQDALAAAQNEAAESKQALEQALNEAAEIKQAYAQVQDEAAQARQALEQVQNENYTAKLELERAKEDLNSANETVKQLKSENAVTSNEELAKAQTDAYMAMQALEQERANTAAVRAETEKIKEAVSQAKNETAALNEQLEQQRKENSILKIQLQAAQTNLDAEKQHYEREAAARNNAVSEYLNALQMACARIDGSKGEIGEKMKKAIDRFTQEWATAQNDLYEMTAKVDEARQYAQMEFVNSTNVMLNALEQIEQYNAQMNDSISDIETRKVKLREELESVIDEFANEPLIADNLDSKSENMEMNKQKNKENILPFVSNIY